MPESRIVRATIAPMKFEDLRLGLREPEEVPTVQESSTEGTCPSDPDNLTQPT